MSVTHVSPESLHDSPVYSHGVIVETARTLYVGGQNGTDAAALRVAGLARPEALIEIEDIAAVP
ncbi:MAG: hypothetical protein RIB67_11630 [Miltoncostaeaceae bacterium]